MATLEPAALRWLANHWESAIDSARGRDDAATFSGIVGDAQHRIDGGYHISREDQPPWNYSVAVFSDDQAGRANLASAIDMTMCPADMALVTGRLAAAWAAQDSRLDHVRGFCGTTDCVTARRWDASDPDPASTSEATDDHLWHIHLEIYRRWADDMDTATAVLSVITGQEDDMNAAEHDTLMATDRRIRAALLKGQSVIDDVPGEGRGQKVWVVEQLTGIKTDLVALRGQAAAAIDYDRLAAALLDQIAARRTS